MKVISSLKGSMGFEYLCLKGVSLRPEGEPRVRGLIPGEQVKLHQSVHWSDIVDSVALGRIYPILPDKFNAKVLRIVHTRVAGKLMSALPGEIIEVEGCPETAQMIAKSQIRPVDGDIWAPSRLSAMNRIREIKDNQTPSGWIKNPDLKVDARLEDKSKAGFDHNYVVHKI